MSTYYINVAAHIGEPSDNENGYIDHPSIKSISEKLPQESNLPFRHTTQEDVTEIIRYLNPRKATGPDLIPPKVVNIAGPEILKSITDMINKSIDGGYFQTFKKWLRLYQSIRKLITLKKKISDLSVYYLACRNFFERVMADQLNTYFRYIFDEALSAFRTGYSCQDTLLALTEKFIKKQSENISQMGSF